MVLGDDLLPRAVLDWDMTTIGAPEHDLAWFTSLDLTMHRLFGQRLAAFPDRDGHRGAIRGVERPAGAGPRVVRDVGHGAEHGRHDPDQSPPTPGRPAPHAAHRRQPGPRRAASRTPAERARLHHRGPTGAAPGRGRPHRPGLRVGQLDLAPGGTPRRSAGGPSCSSSAAGPFHVGVLLENTPEYLFLLAGAALVGAVVVGINPTRRGDELAADIRVTDCQLVITDSTQRGLLDGLDLGVGPERVLAADGDDYRAPAGRHRRSRAPVAGPEPGPDDLFLLIFTSGSTAGPKAVRMTQGRAARSAARIGFSHEDVLYSAMPLFHGNALSAAVLPAFASGATLVLRRRFSASSFLPDIRATGATFFNTVGRAISYIVATPPTEHDRDHRLRYVLGPETSAQDKAEFTRRFGVPLVEGYGSSENAIVLKPVADARPGALGRASDGDDVAVVDPETGEELPRAVFDGMDG